MSENGVLNLSPEDLENVAGGKLRNVANSRKHKRHGGIIKHKYTAKPVGLAKDGGFGGVWCPTCPGCGKVMPGGEGVIRINKKGAESPYFCTECAEKFLNSGDATIDSGYEDLYEKYEKSMNETTGEIWYGWKKKPE